MKQKILIGLSAGALLLMVILTIAPNIDSRSMNTNQFNVAGNRLSIRDGVRLTNQQSGTIKDDAGVTRIILASGAASGFNDGAGASRIEADVGGSVKLKDATANSALEITSIGDAVFSHTAFLDTLLSPDLANTTGFYMSDVTYPGEILFYNSGIPTVSLSRNQSWFNAGSNYFSGVLHVVGKSIFDGTVNSTGTGGSIISQTASNGVGLWVMRPNFNMTTVMTNIWPTNYPSPGQVLTCYQTNDLGYYWAWSNAPSASSSSLFITNGHSVTISNTTAITDLIDVFIPGNTIPTNGAIEIKIDGLITCNGMAFAPTNYLYFGGTQLFPAGAASASLTSSASFRTIQTKLRIYNNDSSTAKSWFWEQNISPPGASAASSFSTAANGSTEETYAANNFTMDSTTNVELKVSMALTNGTVFIVTSPPLIRVIK